MTEQAPAQDPTSKVGVDDYLRRSFEAGTLPGWLLDVLLELHLTWANVAELKGLATQIAEKNLLFFKDAFGRLVGVELHNEDNAVSFEALAQLLKKNNEALAASGRLM